MSAQLRSELLKQRSTSTNLGLAGGMLGLIVLAVALHGFGLRADDLARREDQLMVLGRGEFIAALFAGLLGALSITGEYRHGTIRPTLLAEPDRVRVMLAKATVSGLLGAALGLVGSASAVGVGLIALHTRGIDVRLDLGDEALLMTGAAAAAGAMAAVGVGLGGVIRSQVPTMIAISAWLLFVEGLLGGNLSEVGRFAPGAAGMAVSGQEPGTLPAPPVGLLVLTLYAMIAVIAGTAMTTRRDVA